jgi:hypothetical protein
VDVSWEEMSRTRHPCQCGKGEVEEVHLSDDWGRTETTVSMLCPECRTKYRYVVTGHHKADPVYEWVPVERLDQARKEREERVARARSDCLEAWRAKVSQLRTKKAIWDFVTRDDSGHHSRAYGTFLKDNRGRTLDQIRSASEGVFECVSAHPSIYSKCGVPNPYRKPDFLVEHSA